MTKRNVVLILSTVTVLIGTAATRYTKDGTSRTMASLSSEFPFSLSEPVIKPAKIKEELALSCEGDETQNLADSSQVVMLKFKKCDSFLNKKAVAFNIKNTTNGYQGHIFKEKSARLSSDYIQLDNGENIIEFEIRLNDGQKINKKIKINRLASF